MAIEMRNLRPTDRLQIKSMLSRICEFDIDDQALAMDLVNISLDQPDQKDYIFIIAIAEGRQIVGYACYGPTPLTEGTFDLYWIAVDPDFAGKGIGSSLLKKVEEQLVANHARMLLIETSSNPAYENTRHFYLKNQYHLVETIPDFFKDGEDRVTYAKRFR